MKVSEINKLAFALAATVTGAILAPAAAHPPLAGLPDAWLATGSTTRMPPVGQTTRALTVRSLKDMELIGAGGKEIGEIEGVVVTKADRRQFALVKHGGFLGVGAREVAIPLENASVAGDKVIVGKVTATQLDGMAEFDEDNDTFQELADIQPVILPQR